MTYLRLCVLVLALGGTGTVACTPPPTIVTDPGKRAYTADQVVVRVNELQNAAISANAQNALPEATTRALVEFCVAADKTLAAAPVGWPASLAAAWTAAKAKIGPVANPAITAAMSALDVVLAVAP